MFFPCTSGAMPAKRKWRTLLSSTSSDRMKRFRKRAATCPAKTPATSYQSGVHSFANLRSCRMRLTFLNVRNYHSVIRSSADSAVLSAEMEVDGSSSPTPRDMRAARHRSAARRAYSTLLFVYCTAMRSPNTVFSSPAHLKLICQLCASPQSSRLHSVTTTYLGTPRFQLPNVHNSCIPQFSLIDYLLRRTRDRMPVISPLNPLVGPMRT